MLNKWISDFGGQRGRIFPGMSAFFDFVKQRAESKVLRIQLQNNRNFQLDPHIKIQKKKKHAIYEVFFSDFSVFVFVCLPKRNGAVAVDPALSSDPALYASFPRTRYCFLFYL